MKIYEVATRNNERLDRYLERVMVDVSRSQIKNYILEGLITVNGEIVKAGYKIKNEDQIAVALPETADNTPIPKHIPLDIVHEDSDLLVVNKPKGLLVHPTDRERENTLVSALLHLGIPLAQSGEAYRPGIVHRLDKDTAGLMVVAKTLKAYQALSTLIQNRQIDRHYIALVQGVIGETSGRIDQPIGRNPKNRYLRKVVPEGRKAITRYEVLERYPRYTLVGCQLETGRTHQIRVHLAYLGHPVVGDPLYNQRGVFYQQKGQLLVADRLSFTHPLTEDVLVFEIDLPDYFKDALKIAKHL